MDENRNFLLTVLLCMSIYLGWQYMTGQLEPPPAQQQAQIRNNDASATGTVTSQDGTARAPAGQLPTAAGPGGQGHFADAFPDAGAPAPGAGSSAATAPAAYASQPLVSSRFQGQIRDYDGGLSQLTLPAFAPRVLADDPDEPGQGVALMPARSSFVPNPAQAALSFRLPTGEVPLHFVDGQPLQLAGASADGTQIKVTLRPDPNAYAIDYAIEVHHTGTDPQRLAAGVMLGLAPLDANEAQSTEPPGFFAKYFGGGSRGSDRLRGLVQTQQKLNRVPFSGIAKAKGLAAETAAWAALDEQYFLLAWVPDADAHGHAALFKTDDALGLDVRYETVQLAPGAHWQTHFRLFAGPKRDTELANVDPRLQDSIDYNLLGVPLGFLARPMVFLLRGLHGLTQSWGAAILLLTLVVKLTLLPVVYKSMASMKRMQALKPEMDRLRERYPNDKDRQNQEQLKLFREHGVNPVSGCLPMLLQIPVWITLYRMLWGAVDLYRQPFLWLPDLTAREPFPYLALAVGAATYLQQKVTPMAVDNQQARTMLVVMPAMVTVFMVNLPSGLTLYMLANSVLTIVQQLVMHRRAATPTKA